MKKAQLIEQIALKGGFTKKQTAQMLDLAMDTIVEALAQGESVHLAGFCNISVKEKAAYTGRNPKTGEAIEVPTSRKVVFAPSKALKDKLK
jgi:nucleoid DNA-binding protein